MPGGPLISMIDGRVIGVIVRKATGLSEAFDQLQATLEDNLAILDTIDPARLAMSTDSSLTFISATQRQMKVVVEQMKRFAMVGSGYAIHVHPLAEELALCPKGGSLSP